MVDTMLASSELKLAASVSPDEGIKSGEIAFEVVGDTTGGATIDARPDRWGISNECYLIACIKAGTIKVKATSVDNPEVSATKEFTVKEVLSILESITGKTYSASWSEFDASTYGDITYSYKVTFGNDANNLTAEIEYSKTTEPWYGESEKTAGKFSASVVQEGTNLLFKVLTAIEEATMEVSADPSSLSISLNNDMSFKDLTVKVDDTSKALTEYVDIASLIVGKTFKLEWTSSYGESCSMDISFDNSAGSLSATINYSIASYYSDTSTGKFTACVTINSGSITLTNLTLVESEIATYDYPPTELNFTVKDGEVTFSYESTGSGWDY